MILPPKQVKLCQDSFIEVKTRICAFKLEIWKAVYPLFVKVQIALALMTFAIVAAWWQIVLVIKLCFDLWCVLWHLN
jgi:hypothetical protein